MDLIDHYTDRNYDKNEACKFVTIYDVYTLMNI